MSENEDNGTDRDLSDHDLLLIVNERTKAIKRCLTNHLKHHWAVEIGLLLMFGGALTTLLISMLTKG